MENVRDVTKLKFLRSRVLAKRCSIVLKDARKMMNDIISTNAELNWW